MKTFISLFKNNLKIILTNPKITIIWGSFGYLAQKLYVTLQLNNHMPINNAEILFLKFILFDVYFVSLFIIFVLVYSCSTFIEIREKDYKTLFNKLSLQDATTFDTLIQKRVKITAIEVPFLIPLFYIEQQKPLTKIKQIIQKLEQSIQTKNETIETTKTTLLEQHIAHLEQQKIVELIKQKNISNNDKSKNFL